MSKADQELPTQAQLLEENKHLRARLEEAEQTLKTMRNPEREQMEQALRESEERFRVIASSTPDHILIQDCELRYSFVINPQLNLTEKDMIGKTDYDILAKEDADKLTAVKRQVLETGEPVQMETSLADATGELNFFEGSYIPTFNEKKQVTGLIGYFKNVTERKRLDIALQESEERAKKQAAELDATISSMATGLIVYDATGKAIRMNDKAKELLPQDIFFNMTVEERANVMRWETEAGQPFPPEEIPVARALHGETTHNVVLAACFPDHKLWISASASPIQASDGQRLGVVASFVDITERKKQEEDLQRLNRTLRALSNINQAMMHSTNEAGFMEKVCQIVVKDCGHAMTWIGMAEQDEGKTVRPVASAGYEEGYLETLNITWADTERGRGPTGTAIRTGQVSMCRNMFTDPRFRPWRKEALKRGFASSIVLPLMSEGKAFGALTIYSREPNAFIEGEVELLDELAGDLAYGITMIRTRNAHTQAEEALRQSEERFRQLADASFEGLVIHADGVMLDVNARLTNMLGYDAVELIGKPFWGYVEQKYHDLVRENVDKGSTTVYEVELIHKDGRRVPVEVVGRPLEWKGRQARVSALRDITERKWMENELQKARAEAERRANELNTIFNSITDGIIVYNTEGRIQRANQTAVKMLGFDPSDENMAGLAKALSTRSMDGELLDLTKAPSAQALRGEIVVGERFIIQNPRGQDSIVVASASPLLAGGGIAGAVAIWQDVTEQHKAEETRVWLASFPELNPNPIVELDLFGKIYYLNPVAQKLFPDLEARSNTHPWLKGLGKILADFRHKKSQTATREVQVGEVDYLQSVSYVPRSGRARIYGFNISQRKAAEEELRQTRDELELRVNERTHELAESNAHLQSEIAERKQAEAQLRLQTSAMEAAANGFIITDRQGTIQWCNPAFAEVTGYSCEEVIGLNPRFLKSGRHDRAFYDQMWQTLLNGQVWQGELINRRKDGSLYNEEQVITPVRDEQGQITHFIAVKQDISARKQAEEALRLANAYNRSLLEASLDPLATITPEGKIGDVNSATEKVTGRMRQELIGTDFHSYFSDPEKARAGYQKVFVDGSVRDYELEIRHKDGHVTPVLYNASVYRDEAGKARGVFTLARDITDRKQFEAQLVQAEKHAVIGRMVGSVTHEINNPLQTIKNCLFLIQQDTASDSPTQEPLEMATSETARLTDLVGQLRELYRPRTDLQEHPHELLDILEEVHALLTPHLNNSKVQWDPLTGLTRCYINCIRDQILEVFLNISMNAIEAMQSSGGRLSVDMNFSGEQVGVIFKDSGPGISPEILPHLFEPFMTTKSSGLGLGLSICYGIIQRHGGQIVVENCPEGGASFTIWLPVARKSSKE